MLIYDFKIKDLKGLKRGEQEGGFFKISVFILEIARRSSLVLHGFARGLLDGLRCLLGTTSHVPYWKGPAVESLTDGLSTNGSLPQGVE